MTTHALLASRPSAVFGDDELVFASHADLQAGASSPAFGETTEWSAQCLRRPSNRTHGNWKVRFPTTDPVWNLRVREVCFASFNPVHRALRAASVHLPAEPARVGTMMGVCYRLGRLMAWAEKNQLPNDVARWDREDWRAFIEHTSEQVKQSTLCTYITTVRLLHTFSPILTGGGIAEDPWDGEPAALIAKSVRDKVSTPAIPPQTWWPMMRAAWTYIHTFGPDLLDLRDDLDASPVPPVTDQKLVAEDEPQSMDELLATWLAEPDNRVPVHTKTTSTTVAGEPAWRTLSLTITEGASHQAFDSFTRPGRARRNLIREAVASGQVQSVGRETIPTIKPRPTRLTESWRQGQAVTNILRKWLASPDNRVPVHPQGSRYAEPGTPVWSSLARMVWPHDRKVNTRFESNYEVGRQRRQLVEEVVATGRTMTLGPDVSLRSQPIDCSHFAVVTRPDGSQRPWRESISRDELEHELRILQAAIYVFVVALTMMRDSEIQEIEREALTTYFGSPALRSRKTKHDPSQPELHWWIFEPVAEAIAVAARLSWHPSHVLATINPPSGTKRNGRRGINSGDAIRRFISHVNDTCDRTGLQEIPLAHVAPHMFRKTMSIITGQEPDGEIALGLQLKHAARRALANRTTQGYYAKDPAWAKEFDDQLELAAAAKLVELLKDRKHGKDIAVGPGAARLHLGLDKVLDRIEQAKNDPELRAQVMDDRTVALLLREEFPQLHWGTLNHCLWNADTAECQNSLPPELRGNGPLLGMCQPAKCRNSAITRQQHGAIWLAEENDLTHRLKDKKLAPLRRADLQGRLADVQSITQAWDKEAS